MASQSTASSSLPERLVSLSRYIAVVADELEARQYGDFARSGKLQTERKALENLFRDSEGNLDDRRLEELLPELLTLGVSEIGQEIECERIHREQWASLDHGLCLARLSAPRAFTRGQYLQVEQLETTVDVRL